jgi:hypothetical protein
MRCTKCNSDNPEDHRLCGECDTELDGPKGAAHAVDATTLAQASKCENHCVDLMRIGVDSRLPLRRGVAFPVIRTPGTDEVLGKNASVESMEGRPISFCRQGHTPETLLNHQRRIGSDSRLQIDLA